MKGIEEVDSKVMLEIVEGWCKTGQMPINGPRYGYLAHDESGLWSVCESMTGGCYCEDFRNRTVAELYLTSSIDVEDLHHMDDALSAIAITDGEVCQVYDAVYKAHDLLDVSLSPKSIQEYEKLYARMNLADFIDRAIRRLNRMKIITEKGGRLTRIDEGSAHDR